MTRRQFWSGYLLVLCMSAAYMAAGPVTWLRMAVAIGASVFYVAVVLVGGVIHELILEHRNGAASSAPPHTTA